ncbi:hypothetical protein PCANC_27227 [Puccinia coronata f. sp. avenae]|uniref:HECT-type E3 ubiquitin transferase n=1 Tax=Puccinia coronata f. sp. avenae TaxID=200324 RepID=A0A2N5TIJ7_9BASI|nr:hypothetical protein PCANC_27227 [Puccinia coronata f. sp. avenae]
MDPLDPSLLADYYPGELTIREAEQEEVEPFIVNTPRMVSTPKGARSGNQRRLSLHPTGKPTGLGSSSNKQQQQQPECSSTPPSTPSKLSASLKRRSLNLAKLIRHPTSSTRNRSASRPPPSPHHPDHHHQQNRLSYPAAITMSPHPSPSALTPTVNNSSSSRNSLSPNLLLSCDPPHQALSHLQYCCFYCECCGRSIAMDQNSHATPIRCGVCAIMWDSAECFLPNEKKKQESPYIIAEDTTTTTTTTPHIPPQPSSSSSSSQKARLVITEEHVAQLESLALNQEQIDSFDRDPSRFLAAIQPGSALDRLTKEFDQLAHTLLSQLFQSLSALSTAFLTSTSNSTTTTTTTTTKKTTEATVNLDLLNRFYRAICAGPTGRDLLLSLLYNFLQRPGSQSSSFLAHLKSLSDSMTPPEPVQWAWVIVLLQCPILSSSSKIHPHKRLVVTARILGLISCLPNRIHRRLVTFFSSRSCPTALFADKVELVNLFIGDRIRLFLQSPGGFASTLQQPLRTLDLPKYMYDWSLLAASRVMALLTGSNALCSKVAITTFYNVSADLIGGMDLVTDFEMWESRKSPYTLCGYPYLLSIASKISLLTYDGKRQMGLEARQAVLDSLMGRSLASPVFSLSVRRDHLVEDSLHQISNSSSQLKKLLKISFVDEDGVDGGGLKKEWFLLLIRQLVAPEYGMFIHDTEHHHIWFNPASQELEEFRLIGTVLGLAIYNRATLDFGLPLVGYRKLLGDGSAVGGLEDLATLQPEVARNLRWLLAYEGADFEELCGRNFVAGYDMYGTVVEKPLKPHGDKIPVTRSNRAEFVELYCDWVLNRSIAAQFQAFAEGFKAVAAGNALSLFRPEEIELLVVGSAYTDKLPVAELQAVTVYEGFIPTDNTVRFFWQVVDRFSFDEQKKLLRFITGTDRIPAVGLASLHLKICKSAHSYPDNFSSSLNSNSNDPHHTSSPSSSSSRRRLRLSAAIPSAIPSASAAVPMARKERIPESHTCFNQLILSEFESPESLELKLRLAINESEGFSLN